jgi:transcriptional regulator with XRE-family HTH domain
MYAMPMTNPAAKKWQDDRAARLGRAVRDRRKDLKMTADDLARRTAELGYPITRVAIGKLENNYRAGKFDSAEVDVLAAALDLSPADLLHSGPPDELVEVLPGQMMTLLEARIWHNGGAEGLWPLEEAAALIARLDRISHAVTRSANLQGHAQLGSRETYGWTAAIAGTEES